MTEPAAFDPEAALHLLLDAAEEVVRVVDNLTITLLQIDTRDHRRTKHLLSEALDLLTNPDTRVDLRDWKRSAEQLVTPSDDERQATQQAIRDMLNAKIAPGERS